MTPDETSDPGSTVPFGHHACAACVDDLAHLVLGELPAERVAAVEAHCATCASCRAERELLAKSAALIAADAPKLAPLLALSEARQQALLATATAAGGGGAHSPIRKFWSARRLTAAAAAIVAVAIGGNWLWRSYDLGGRGNARTLRPYLVAGSAAELAREQRGERDRVDAAGAAWMNGPAASTADAHRGMKPLRASDGDATARKEELLEQLAEATTANDPAAARAAIDALGTEQVALDPAQLAALSIDLSQAEQPELALELLKQAPDAKTLDESTRLKLERVTEYVLEKLPADGTNGAKGITADDLKQLQALGYLAYDEAEVVEDLASATTEQMARGHYAGPADGVPPNAATPLSRLSSSLDAGISGLSDQAPTSGRSLQTLAKATDFGSTPVPPVGGLGQSQSDRFDDGLEAGTALTLWCESLDAWSRGLSDFESGSAAATDEFATEAKEERALVDATLIANLSLAAPSDLVAFEGALGRAAAAGRTVDVDAVVKSFLAKLSPQQGETPRDMFFRWFGDHAVVPTRIDRRSTFGMDVDTASYNLARAYLAKGTLPPKAAVRTEEFVNAFKQGLAAPTAAAAAAAGGAERSSDGIATTSADDIFALTTELAPSPFGAGKHLLRVGLKAREIDRAARKPAVLTFVIDVSGSMNEGGRLELVKQALRLLVAQLDERDSVGIVVFSENARIALPPTRGSDRERILAALDPLRPEQSTNAGAGLRLGYDLAVAALQPEADNRVVMCSDGVANSGVTDPDQLTARIRECKSRRIALTTVGVGMNNVNDALLEQLAREGDGNCHYVDGLAEAKELFVDKLTGTLTTVARDAKIQVEFEPGAVVAFRQLGYENRALKHQDFRNDRVDAGEVGAGHEVVALYELDLAPEAVGPLATVRCRYEDPRTATVREQARICFGAEMAKSAGDLGPHFRLCAAVAEFAELLRQSMHARDGSLSAVLRLAEPLVAELPEDPDVPEFVALVQQAARLPDLLPARTAIVRCVDEIKRTRCWQHELRQLDPTAQQANSDLMNQLEEQNRKLEQALRDALAQAATRR